VIGAVMDGVCRPRLVCSAGSPAASICQCSNSGTRSAERPRRRSWTACRRAMWASNAAPIEMAKSGGLSTRNAGRIGFAPTRAMACRVQALHCRGRENSPSRPYDSGDDGCRSADDQRTILGRATMAPSALRTALITGPGKRNPAVGAAVRTAGSRAPTSARAVMARL
jgi:hypothetical protein